MKKIPCGVYRTTVPIGEEIREGMLVYYHNHGEPGPGLYLPREWRNNRAVFEEKGTTVPDEDYPATLEPLFEEGFYRVAEPFYCCEQQCQHFEEEMLVQVGYNGDAEAIIFVPEVEDGALVFPDEGTFVEDWKLNNLRPLKVAEVEGPDRVLN